MILPFDVVTGCKTTPGAPKMSRVDSFISVMVTVLSWLPSKLSVRRLSMAVSLSPKICQSVMSFGGGPQSRQYAFLG